MDDTKDLTNDPDDEEGTPTGVPDPGDEDAPPGGNESVEVRV